MKVWWVAVSVAWVCTCWMAMLSINSAVASPPPVAAAVTTITAADHNRDQDYNNLKVYRVKFTTQGATRNSYLRFMIELYNAFVQNADRSGVIPVLPSVAQWRSLDTSRQYVYVELSNGQFTVTLALNTSNAYIVGYVAGGGVSYFFREVPVELRNTLFPNTRAATLPYGYQYDDLQKAAMGIEHDRRNVELGIWPLSSAIENLYTRDPNDGGQGKSRVARAFLVIVQMVSEALRFRNLRQQILDTIHGVYDYGTFRPTDYYLALETSWDPLSERVQSATDGVFRGPVTLTLGGRAQEVFNTVSQVLPFLALMLFECTPPSRLPLPSSSSLILPSAAKAVRSALELDHVHRRQNDVCPAGEEPTVHLLGLDGLCADVYQGLYRDGDKIVLYPCGGPNKVNQLWTLKSDQTIRSNGKCLTTYGYSPNSYVMIYDCDTAMVRATKWEMLSNGAIRNPRSGLVLTAIKYAYSDTINVVVDNFYLAAKQAWAATNVTKPLATKIVAGYEKFCLQTAGSGEVRLDSCKTNSDIDKWLVYPDSTIRPYANNQNCLKAEFDMSVLTITYCNGFIHERWSFRSDSTIYHLYSGQVIDVEDTSATVLQVTVKDHDPNRLSQVWFQDRI